VGHDEARPYFDIGCLAALLVHRGRTLSTPRYSYRDAVELGQRYSIVSNAAADAGSDSSSVLEISRFDILASVNIRVPLYEMLAAPKSMFWLRICSRPKERACSGAMTSDVVQLPRLLARLVPGL